MVDKKEKKDGRKNDVSNEYLNSGDIIDRVKELIGVPNDMKLAHEFKISQNTIYSWRARNNADLTLMINLLFQYFPEKMENFDFNWLITGKSSNYSNEDDAIEISDSMIESLNQEIESLKNAINTLAKIIAEKSAANQR